MKKRPCRHKKIDILIPNSDLYQCTKYLARTYIFGNESWLTAAVQQATRGWDKVSRALACWSACLSSIFCRFLVGASRFVVCSLCPLASPPPPLRAKGFLVCGKKNKDLTLPKCLCSQTTRNGTIQRNINTKIFPNSYWIETKISLSVHFWGPKGPRDGYFCQGGWLFWVEISKLSSTNLNISETCLSARHDANNSHCVAD